MLTSTTVHARIRQAISGAGVWVTDGPADVLPTSGGRVGQFVVLWPLAPMHQHVRMTGDSSGRVSGVVAVCGGASVLDALAVADKVHAALNGLTVSSVCSPLRQTVSSGAPAVEPNADPQRVSVSLEFTTITKG